MREIETLIDPDNSKQIGKLVMTKELAIKWTVLMIPLLIVFLASISILLTFFSGKEGYEVMYNTSRNHVQNILIFSILAISTIIFHELIHGVFMSKYGGKPRYGVGLAHYVIPFAYATTDAVFRRNQYVTIALAPLLVITAVGMVFMAAFPDLDGWMIIPLAFNFAGAVGDLWMTFVLLRLPGHVVVKDDITGITFYGKPSDEQMDYSSDGLVYNFIKGFAGGFIIFILLNSIFQSQETGFIGLSLSFPPILLPVSVFAGLIYAFVKTVNKKRRD